ncbi:GNAT family N-acetyltransferase [Candidatus Bathyarchaeota archaeon]|nr:GNAT family N-acetyltransferase [Candidatus Bathyarchaeota archaeon]
MAQTRQATQKDIPKILEYRQKLQQHLTQRNPKLWRRDPDSPSLRKEVEDTITQEGGWCIVAEIDRRPVGFISGAVKTRVDEHPPIIGIIGVIYVEPEFRRMGVGGQLVKELLERFTDQGAEDITLRHVVGNTEAEQFWNGLGFEPRITVANATPSRVKQSLDNKPFNRG